MEILLSHKFLNTITFQVTMTMILKSLKYSRQLLLKIWKPAAPKVCKIVWHHVVLKSPVYMGNVDKPKCLWMEGYFICTFNMSLINYSISPKWDKYQIIIQ